MRRLAPLAVLLGLVTACGGGSAKGVSHGTMQAVYGDLRRNPAATYKVEFQAAGLGVKRITSYWKNGKARIDTVGTRQNSRHFATTDGLIECNKTAKKFDCIYKNTPSGYSFRLNAGPDWSAQLAIARSAGRRPSKREILGQTVDCWRYDPTEGSLEQETCTNSDGAILFYRGGARGAPFRAVAVSYSTKVSNAEVRAPKARNVPFIVLATTTSTTVPTGTTAIPPPP